MCDGAAMKNPTSHLRSNRIHQRSYSGTSHTHQHNFHQLILPRRGRLELQCGAYSGEAAAEQGALIPAGEAHAFSSRGENAFWVIDVVATQQNQALFDLNKHSPFFRLTNTLQTQLDFADRRGALLGHAEVQHLWSNSLLMYLQTQSQAKEETEHLRLRRALNLMQSRIQHSFDVHELAAEVHMSATQLHRLFQQHLHTTPQRWMSTLRMHLAPQLLALGLDLSQVALQCGFADQSSFGKAFKRFHGLPPAQWLKQQMLTLSTTRKSETRKAEASER